MNYNPTPVVLLGAGASAEADVPTTFKMTRRLVDAVAGGYPGSQTAQALNFVCGALVLHDSAQGRSPYEALDVERVFAAVGLLAQRRELEVTPFVSSWQPAVDAWDAPPLPSLFDRRFLEKLGSPAADASRNELVKLVRAATGKGDGRVYERLTADMVRHLVHLIAVQPKSTGYLIPLLRSGQTLGPLTIATLNYDRSIELAAQAEDILVHTGLTEWTKTKTWNWPKRGVRLLKLHGSIDWRWERSPNTPLRNITVEQTEDPQDDRRPPAIVFGARGKLQVQGPFLSLLSEFELQLGLTDRLIVIGYPFRDQHVNEVIRRWVVDGDAREITIVDPEPSRADFVYQLAGHLNPRGSDHRRLHFLKAPASQGISILFNDTV